MEDMNKGSIQFKKPAKGPFVDHIEKLRDHLDHIDWGMLPSETYALQIINTALFEVSPSPDKLLEPNYDDLEDYENILKALEMITKAVKANINQL